MGSLGCRLKGDPQVDCLGVKSLLKELFIPRTDRQQCGGSSGESWSLSTRDSVMGTLKRNRDPQSMGGAVFSKLLGEGWFHNRILQPSPRQKTGK